MEGYEKGLLYHNIITSKERQQKYRDKIKQDPVKYTLYKEKNRLRQEEKPVQDEERSDTDSVNRRDDESSSSDEMKSVKDLDDDVESDDNDDNEKMRRYASTLLMLQNANPKVKRMVIHKAGKELMNCLCECGRNILKGTVPISKAQLRDLKRYEKHLRCINKKSVSIKKKKLILQKGGFLGTFLKPLVGMLLDLTK